MNNITTPERTNKATHTGTCQACGRSQKLPADRLSKHGYTVEWGFFNGTCPGSHHLPFEKSCALIQSYIENARLQLASAKERQAELRTTPVTNGRAYVHDYDSTGRKWFYVWREVDVIATDHQNPGSDYKWTSYTYISITYNETKRLDFYDPKVTDLASACLKLNQTYADSFNKRIEQLESYIAWQTKRVTEWKETELKPIK